MPEDEINLHRLIWSPDEFDGDQLLPSAFRRKDLDGSSNSYISVSRVDQLQPDAERSIASDQAQKTRTIVGKREESWSVLFNCRELRAVADDEGVRTFNATSEPIETNQAHCGIRNISQKKGHGYVNMLRIKLIELAKNKTTLEEFLAQFKS